MHQRCGCVRVCVCVFPGPSAWLVFYTCPTARCLRWRLNSSWLKDAGSRLLAHDTRALAVCALVCIMYGCACGVSLIECPVEGGFYTLSLLRFSPASKSRRSIARRDGRMQICSSHTDKDGISAFIFPHVFICVSVDSFCRHLLFSALFGEHLWLNSVIQTNFTLSQVKHHLLTSPLTVNLKSHKLRDAPSVRKAVAG